MAAKAIHGSRITGIAKRMDSVVFGNELDLLDGLQQVWAVKFENGEMHRFDLPPSHLRGTDAYVLGRYNIEQLRDKFGVEHVQNGMKITHRTRGHGTVMTDDTQHPAMSRSQRHSLMLESSHGAPQSTIEMVTKTEGGVSEVLVNLHPDHGALLTPPLPSQDLAASGMVPQLQLMEAPTKMDALEADNAALRQQLTKMDALAADNAALRHQLVQITLAQQVCLSAVSIVVVARLAGLTVHCRHRTSKRDVMESNWRVIEHILQAGLLQGLPTIVLQMANPAKQRRGRSLNGLPSFILARSI